MKHCGICNGTDNIIMHHVAYEPERKMDVCRSCHGYIHHGNRYPQYKPSKEDTESHYGIIDYDNRITICFNREHLAILRAIADKERRSISKQVVYMLEFYIENKDKVK